MQTTSLAPQLSVCPPAVKTTACTLSELKANIKEFIEKMSEDLSEKLSVAIFNNRTIGGMAEAVKGHVMEFGAQVVKEGLSRKSEPGSMQDTHNTKRIGQRSRELLTVLGPVDYSRPGFYDQDTGQISFPDDEVFDILPGRVQKDLLEKIVQVGVEVPYAETARICKNLTGVLVSEGTVYNCLTRVGESADMESVLPELPFIEKSMNQLKLKYPKEKVHIVIGIDGAMEPLRPQKSQRSNKRGECFWQEAKGIRVYGVAGEKALTHLVSWHQICTESQLRVALEAIWNRIEPLSEPKVVVADGAKWIWKLVGEVCRGHTEILDWYHVAQHLSQFSKDYYKADKDKQEYWLTKVKNHLLSPEPHGVSHVFASLNTMKTEDTLKLEAKRKVTNYLKTNLNRLNYGLAKANGLTIGSGGMESANKFIAHSRLKRCGAWWKPTHANEMLRLKCAKANGTLQRIINTNL